MKFLMYGAGSIGRGFIGPLFAGAGYEVVYVDISKPIIDALNNKRNYQISIASETPYNIEVYGVRGVNGLDEEAVIAEIADCDIMAVSLGTSVLQRIVPVIAKGFALRIEKCNKPLNVLICENLKNADKVLREWLLDALPVELHQLFNEKCGLIETAIGRMVPVTDTDSEDPLHVVVEEYDFLPIDRDGFIGDPPQIEKLIPYSPFSFYEERKLYLHNMGHAICAYLGILNGYDYIYQAIRDPFIRLLTQSAMIESSSMLSTKYEVPYHKVFYHAEDLLFRFGNAALLDTCERVGRDPIRKLGADDRLAGAIKQCFDYGILPAYICLGYAVALRFMTDDLKEVQKVSKEIGKLTDEQISIIMKLYDLLSLTPEKLFEATESIKREQRGRIV